MSYLQLCDLVLSVIPLLFGVLLLAASIGIAGKLTTNRPVMTAAFAGALTLAGVRLFMHGAGLS